MAMNDVPAEQAFDFTRATPKWVWNASGQLVEVPADQPAYDHDPVTGEALGVLIESAATNYFTDNADLSTSTVRGGELIYDGDTVSPDSVSGVYELVEAEDSEDHGFRLERPRFDSRTVGTSYTVSAFFKAGRSSTAFIRSFGFFGGTYVVFDLDTGNIIDASSGANYKVTPCGNGWFRAESEFVLVDPDSTLSTQGFVGIGKPDGSIYWPGVAGEHGVYIWGLQIEEGPVATSYIPTAGAPVTRAADNMSRTLGAEFNPSEGTFFIDTVVSAPDFFELFGYSRSSTARNGVWVSKSNSEFRLFLGGGITRVATVPFTAIGGFDIGEVNRVVAAFSYSSSSGLCTLSVNGASSTSQSDLTYTDDRISPPRAAAGGSARPVSSTSSIGYYPYAMTAAELEALTAL